jgi:hypothetical protein
MAKDLSEYDKFLISPPILDTPPQLECLPHNVDLGSGARKKYVKLKALIKESWGDREVVLMVPKTLVGAIREKFAEQETVVALQKVSSEVESIADSLVTFSAEKQSEGRERTLLTKGRQPGVTTAWLASLDLSRFRLRDSKEKERGNNAPVGT